MEFSPATNCIVGLNGMGKTNLLDAIYYLCMCKSYFSQQDNLVVQQTADFLRVEGLFKKEPQKVFNVVAKVKPREKKEIEVNGTLHEKLADHIGLFPVVMITPYDIGLALEGSEVRRRFLDNSLSQIDRNYLNALLDYNRILRQRNATLKSYGTHNTLHALLDILDEQLLSPAKIIAEKRQAFCGLLLPFFQQYYRIISNEQEQVNCSYHSQLKDLSLRVLLKENRQKDVLLQRSTVGIHKDDLIFTIEERPLKKFASQGQLKSFILALKLAQYNLVKTQKDCPPLLLLDDIFDKLDGKRVQQLLKLLLENDFGQIFFTDTDEDRLFKLIEPFNIDVKRFVVHNGKINKRN